MDRFLYHCGRALAWLALGMAFPFAAAHAQTFLTAPLNVSGTGHAVIPSIAAGPNGEIDVVWLDSNAILFRRTLDAGNTFSATMTVATTNLPSQASQPQVAVNSKGVYVAWAGTNSSGGGDIFVSALASGSTSGFSTLVNVSGGKGIASGGAPVPHMAAEPGGAVDVVWGQTAAYFVRSTDGWKTFALTPLSGSAMQRVSPRIAIGAQGYIYVVWVNADPNFPNCSSQTIQFARSTDGGGGFGLYSVDDTVTISTTGQSITGCTSDVQIAVGANSSIHLLWANENPQIQDLITTYAAEPFPAGSTFPETAFQNLSTTASHTPEMAIDSSGNINVVWMGDASNSDSRQLVYFSRSTDGGGKFTSPQQLTTAPASGALATGFPQIAVEPSGPIDLLWQHASAADPANAYDIVLARSTDGATFPSFTLDNSPTITGNTGQLAVDTSGNVYAVWVGNSGSSADIMLNGDSKTLAVGGLTASVSPVSATINVGGSASFTVSLTSTGFSGGVSLACSAPAGISCGFNPGSVSLASGAASAMLNVSVTAKPSAVGALRNPGDGLGSRPQEELVIAAWMWGIGLVAFLATVITRRRKASGLLVQTAGGEAMSYKGLAFARTLAFSLLLAAMATGITSCGGSTSNGGGGGSNTFPLIVQAKTSSGTTNLQTISITVP